MHPDSSFCTNLSMCLGRDVRYGEHCNGHGMVRSSQWQSPIYYVKLCDTKGHSQPCSRDGAVDNDRDCGKQLEMTWMQEIKDIYLSVYITYYHLYLSPLPAQSTTTQLTLCVKNDKNFWHSKSHKEFALVLLVILPSYHVSGQN